MDYEKEGPFGLGFAPPAEVIIGIRAEGKMRLGLSAGRDVLPTPAAKREAEDRQAASRSPAWFAKAWSAISRCSRRRV